MIGAVRLRVTYHRIVDFLQDHEQQLTKGSLLVRVEAPADLERGTPVELELVTPVGRAGLEGEVLQVLGGAGIAVALPADRVEELVARARDHRGADDGEPPTHEIAPARPAADDAPQSREAQQAKLVQQALHGDRNQRMAILRQPNKLLHKYVVRNPQIELEEIVFIARMKTVAPDVLQFIASRRDWAERPEVATALVRNPKLPVPLAIKLLDHVLMPELRQLAKSANVREAVLRAVRKKVLR